MHHYELALILDATIEDEARKDIFEKIKGLIERFGGTVTDVDEWGKRKLAYEIQKMPEGYYYFVQIEAPGTTPADLEDRLRIMDHVLRFLIFRKDEDELQKKPSVPPTEETAEAPVEEPSDAAAEAPPEEPAE